MGARNREPGNSRLVLRFPKFQVLLHQRLDWLETAGFFRCKLWDITDVLSALLLYNQCSTHFIFVLWFSMSHLRNSFCVNNYSDDGSEQMSLKKDVQLYLFNCRHPLLMAYEKRKHVDTCRCTPPKVSATCITTWSLTTQHDYNRLSHSWDTDSRPILTPFKRRALTARLTPANEPNRAAVTFFIDLRLCENSVIIGYIVLEI